MNNTLMFLQLFKQTFPLLAAYRRFVRTVSAASMAVIVFVAFSFPQTAVADIVVSLPESAERVPRIISQMALTAYTSDPAETDSTPFITASGTIVRRGVLASNYFPIGTRVRIPELYGDEVFVVEDRMNARYHKRMDVWMEEKGAARAFGVRHATIEVF